MPLRNLFALLALLTLTQAAPAQVIAVLLKEDVKGSLAKLAVEIEGHPAIVGEPGDGIRYTGGGITYTSNGPNKVFVADPGKPEVVPYEVVDGEREPTSKKSLVTIDGSDIRRIVILMRDESLAGLSREYVLRTEQIEELREARDELDKTTAAWAAVHVRLVTAMERLSGWLRRVGFSEAANDLDKDRRKIEKRVRDDAVRARRDKAIDSVKEGEVPETLTSLAQELSGGSDVFRCIESQHLRIYYIEALGEPNVRAAMHFGEEIIEGFRAEFVDPYVAADYPDRIPEGVFCEWLFVPNDNAKYEGYTKGLWQVSWERNREERLAMGGGRMDGSTNRAYRFFRKNHQLDLEALVCHALGHALAGVHYGAERGNIKQDWLSEGVAYYLSFEFLARNGVTCKAFDIERSGYVRREVARAAGEKTIGVARREMYNQVALQNGRPIDQLALRDLVVMDDADLAKSWSFFDYVARKEGEAGQRWLRSAGEHANERQTFIANWRKDASAILEVDPGRAFKAIEERWKEFATLHQHTDERTRRRR